MSPGGARGMGERIAAARKLRRMTQADLVVAPVSSSGVDHAARAWGWVLSWASIRRSRSLRSSRVNFQLNGLAMAL